MADYQLNRSGLLCYSALSSCTRRSSSSGIVKKGPTVASVCLYRQRTQELATLDVRFTTKRPSAGTLERGSGLFAPGAGDDTSIGTLAVSKSAYTV